MRVLLQSWGTEGDLRPFLALSQALLQRGHHVDLLFTGVEGKDFSALAANAGVTTHFVDESYFVRHREVLLEKSRASFLAGNPVAQFELILRDMMDPVIDAMTAKARSFAGDADVVVGHFLAHSAAAAAEEAAKPYVQFALQPVYTSAHYPPAGAPNMGALLQRFGWMAANYVMRRSLLPRVNQTRLQCGLEPLAGFVPAQLGRPSRVLVAVSPTLFPRPRDWSSELEVSGFSNLTEHSVAWAPEPHLQRFLSEAPPVFLSFGSMLGVDADPVTMASVRAFAEALTLANARGVVQASRAAIALAPKQDNVCYIARAPHAQLFPRCSAIVHHGGAGTTQSALLAGRGSIVVPHAADQFYWADLLYARGVASKPLKRTKLAAKPLAERIRSVLDDAAMVPRAERIAAQLRAEEGALRAAELIEACARVRA